MNITEREQNGIVVVSIDGRIDTEGAVDLDQALQKVLGEGHYNMVLDMTEVRYVSSAGLRTLADVLTRSRENNGDVKMAALNTKVMRVMQVVGFHNFFRIYDTVDTALAAF